MTRGCMSAEKCGGVQPVYVTTVEPADYDASPDTTPKNREARRAKKAALRHAKKQGRKVR